MKITKSVYSLWMKKGVEEMRAEEKKKACLKWRSTLFFNFPFVYKVVNQ